MQSVPSQMSQKSQKPKGKYTMAFPKKPNEPKLKERATYKSLHENLVEEGCPISAKYFNQLVAKENELALTDLKFKKRVSDSHCLLLAIVENIKSAELEYQELQDREVTLKLLVQTVHMIKVQDEAFHWLVREFYSIILKLSRTWHQECEEILARTRFEFGVVLSEKGDSFLKDAIINLSKSLERCKGTMWFTNDRDRNILHEDVCVKLCETLLRQAKIKSRKHPNEAAHLAHRAVLTIVEVGISLNKNLYCIAKLRQTEYLIADSDYEGAFRVLNSLQNHIMANDSMENKCEFYLWLGICHFYLSPNGMAMRKFKLSLCLSENYDFAHLKAKALLYLGKIHAQNSATQAQAKQCFVEAKDLFRRLRDFENEKFARFLMAKLRAYQIFPTYIELIKRATWVNFCNLFDLIQWKQKMLPFWDVDGELLTYEDEFECLLEPRLAQQRTTLAD